MNAFQTILILLFAFLAIFAETVFSAPRNLLGAQIDLLPALMVFTALSSDLITVGLLAVLAGLGFDSLSENPLGVTILPLMLVGFPIHLRRDLILRGLPFAQFVLGAAASALVPVLVNVLLLNGGKQPLIGWGSLWQWLVMTVGGAAATPVIFAWFAWCDRALGYQPRSETSFRPDREIQRGRNKE
jgi:cell shape-determining protein MreD